MTLHLNGGKKVTTKLFVMSSQIHVHRSYRSKKKKLQAAKSDQAYWCWTHTLTCILRVLKALICVLFLQSCWRWTQTRGLRCAACVTMLGCRTTASFHPTHSWPLTFSARPLPPSTLASKLPLMYSQQCKFDLDAPKQQGQYYFIQTSYYVSILVIFVQMQLQPFSQHKLEICSLWMKKACTPKQCRKEGET